MTTLGELGERRIVSEVLAPFVQGIGDDCAAIPLDHCDLSVTTDPVPHPAAQSLGGDSDPFYMGWLLVVINASDLAASGASPLGFLAAIHAPTDLPVASFQRLLEGIAEACKAEGLRYIGGNLRESDSLGAVGTAIGYCPPKTMLSRMGAGVGDIVASIGQGGMFWRDVLWIRSSRPVVKESSPLFRPKSQLVIMHRLAALGLINAAIDNSDGLLPTLRQLAQVNSVQVLLDIHALTVPDFDDREMSKRCWLGWGDWNVVVAISPNNFDAACSEVRSLGGTLTQIGRVRRGAPGVVWGSSEVDVPRLESERFAADSWFVQGIETYLERLSTLPLPT